MASQSARKRLFLSFPPFEFAQDKLRRESSLGGVLPGLPPSREWRNPALIMKSS